MKKLAKVWDITKSNGRRALAFALAVATFVTSINMDWSALVVAEAAWTAEPEYQLFGDTGGDNEYNTAIDLTTEGLVFSANETGQLGAIITPSGSSNFEYPKAVSFCVDVPANTSFTTSAAAYQNITNPTSVTTPAGIASGRTARYASGDYTYSNTSSEIKTVVCTIFLGDCGVRACASVSETYGVVVNITGTGDIKYYTGNNGNTGERYVNSNTDSSRALVVTTASANDDIADYNLISTSWEGVKYLGVGDSTTYTATVSHGKNSYKRVISYEITDTSGTDVASIDSSTGVIVANNPGTATVVAKTASGITSTPKEIAVYNAVFADTKAKTTDARVYPNPEDTAPQVTVETLKDTTWTTTGFTITYPADPTSVGTKTITVDGGTNYPGFYQELSYEVTAQELPSVAELETYRDAGNIIINVGTNEVLSSTSIFASDGTTPLILGTDYTAVASNKQVNEDGSIVTYDVTFTGMGNYTGTRKVSNVSALNATPTQQMDISSLSAWIDDSDYVYNNSVLFRKNDNAEAIPNLYFTDGNGDPVGITKGDITISSIKRNNSNATQVRDAGTYIITLTGNNIYTGSIDVEFSVAKLPLTLEAGSGFSIDPEGDVTVLHESDSTTITPSLIYNNGVEDYPLTSDDITYSYTGETSIGNATVTMRATDSSNFTGYIQKNYTIVPNIKLSSDITIKINGVEVTKNASTDAFYTSTYNPTYSGKTFVGKVTDAATQTAPTISVRNNSTGKTLRLNTDFFVTVTDGYDNTNAGSASFTFTMAGGNENNSVDVHFSIRPKDMTTASFVFTGATNSLYYTGDAITLGSDQYDVYYNGDTRLVEGTDYKTIEGTDYEDNINAGTAKIYAQGIGNYSGQITGYFEIKPRSINEKDGDGNVVAPHTSRKKDENFGVQAVMNPAKTVGLTPNGELKKNYLDGDEVTLNYYNDTTNPDYDFSLNYVGFNGATEDYTVNRLNIGRDFTASYTNNRKVAKWNSSKAPTVTVTGTGNYTGTRTLTFTIQPASLCTLALNVNSVPIINPEVYVPYASTGTTPSTTGSYVAMEYNGSTPMPTVEFTEKTLIESDLDGAGDYTTCYFDDYDVMLDAIDQAKRGVLNQPANVWTKDVNAVAGEEFGYKYILIWGLNNYAGDYKIIQFKFLPRNIALPSITTQVKTSDDPTANPDVIMYDKGLSDASLKNQKLVEGTDFELMMYDSTGALVPFEPDAAPGSSKEIVIVGIGNYKNSRSVFYKAGINLSAYTSTVDTANKYLDLKDNTGEGDPEHYIRVKNPISGAVITPRESGDTVFSISYLGQSTTPVIQLWRVKQEGEATDTQIFGVGADTSGGIDIYEEADITVKLEPQGESNGYNAGSIVKVTVMASPTSAIYYGQTSFYYQITKADLSDVVVYDDTSLDYTMADKTTQAYPVYPYTGGKVSTNIKAMYGDEPLTVNTVTTHSITGSASDYDTGEEISNAVDTGIIDKSVYFNENSGFVDVDSTEEETRKNYTIGHTGNDNPFMLAITVDDENFDPDAVKYIPYIIRGMDFADATGTKAAYGKDYSRVVLEKDGEYYTNDQNLTYNGGEVTDYTPLVQVKVNGNWVDLNPDTYRCEWVKWDDASTKPETSAPAATIQNVGKYTVKIRPFANNASVISKLGRTASRYVTETPVLTVGPRVTSTDLTATLSDTLYTYDAAIHNPTITIVDNSGTPDDTTDDVTLVEGTDYNVLYYNSATDVNARYPGTYTPAIEFINNYQGSSVEVPSFRIKGNFNDDVDAGTANTYTDVNATINAGPYYLVQVNGQVLNRNVDNMVLYLSNRKLYFDEALTNEFTADDIALYYQDTSAHEPQILTSAPNGGKITDFTVRATDLKIPGNTGTITVTGNTNSLFAGSSVTLTGFTVKADMNDVVVKDNDGNDMSGIAYNYDPNATSTATVTGKISEVNWGTTPVDSGDYTVAVTGSNRLDTPTTGTITLTAEEDSFFFGSKELEYSVSMKLYGYKVWFSNDESTAISTGTYSVGYDDIMLWPPSTQVFGSMYTKDASGNEVPVNPLYYTMTISNSQATYTSSSNSGTVSKFTDGTDPTLASAFTPGTYQISFVANDGASLDSSIASDTPSFTVNAMALDHYVNDTTMTFTYNGGPIKPDELDSTFAVYNKFDTANPLVKGTDYTVTYSNNINAASSTATNAPTLTITGRGNYTGTLTMTFTIERKSISGATVTVPDQYYTGSPIYPVSQVEVMDGSTTLTRNTHYTVDNDSFSNNTEVSTPESKARVTVTGAGNYKGTATGEFSILPLDFTKAGLIATSNECEYTGKRIYGEKPATSPTGAYVYIKPEDAHMDDEGVLKIQIPNAEDPAHPITLKPSLYTVTIDGYDYVTDANEYGYDITIKAKPSSNYSGQKTFKYYVHQKPINADDWTIDWSAAEKTYTKNNVSHYGTTYNYGYKFGLYDANGNASLDYDYNGGNGVEPTVGIIDQTYWTGTSTSVTNKALVKDTDFTISYDHNTVGASKDDPEAAPTVTITGTGNYTGQITKTFNIGISLEELYNNAPRFTASSLETFEYNALEQLPEDITVHDKKENVDLVKDTDYTFDASTDKINAGKQKLIVTGVNNYYGTIEYDETNQPNAYYTIAPLVVDPTDASKWSITLNTTGPDVTDVITPSKTYQTETYKGKALKPSMTVKYTEGETTYTFTSRDFEVDYKYNTNANMVKAGDGYTRKSPASTYPLATAQPVLLEGGNFVFAGIEGGEAQALEKKSFAILPFDLSSVGKLTVVDSDAEDFPDLVVEDNYAVLAFDDVNHSAIVPHIRVTFTGDNVPDAIGPINASNSDLTLNYTDNRDPGLATVTVTGASTGNYYGSLSTNFHVVANIESEHAHLTLDSNVIKPYTDGTVGYPITEVKYVFDDGSELVINEGTNYTLSALKDGHIATKGDGTVDNVWKTEGPATLIVTGVNPHFAGSITADYTYDNSGEDPSGDTPEFDRNRIVVDTTTTTFIYDTKKHYPKVTTVYDTTGRLLTEGTDYTVTYSASSGDAKSVGVSTTVAKITGIGNYVKARSVSVSTDVTILRKNIGDSDVIVNNSSFVDVTYTGSPITPTTSIVYNGTTLAQNRDYTITYINNVDPGVACVRISGINNFEGAKADIFFTINTIKVTGLKVSSKTKTSVTLTWTKSSKVAGYTVSYMLNGRAKSVSTSNNTVTISGLTSATTYSFAVRSYVTSTSTSRTYYGDASRVSATTK